jgi:hypothetical protein
MASRFLIDHPRSMLVADPGLGKTSITLAALDLLKISDANAFPALVLAPKRVADVVWTNERDKWSCFQDMTMIKVMGPEEQRKMELRRKIADVYVINYDLIPWLVEMFPGERWPFRTVIADESSKLKGFRLSKGGVRAKALSMIAKYTAWWWNLTGTPIPNGLQDLWGQMYFVDFGERLKRSYTAYKEAFFIENQWSHKITLQYGAEKAIHDLVADRMLALRAEDWLPIEKPLELPMEFELPAAVMAQYRALERDYFLDLGPGKVNAGTAAVKSFKLLQLVSGSVFDTEQTVRHVHDAKLDVLEENLEKIAPEPLLLSYWWTFDPERIGRLLDRLKLPYAVYKGKEQEDQWNAGKLRVLLLQEQSAYGLNLASVCRDVCFYSYPWNAELWTQMIERIGPARQVQVNSGKIVRIWTIQAKGTIEGDVIDSNAGKISMEQALKRARARRTL